MIFNFQFLSKAATFPKTVCHLTCKCPVQDSITIELLLNQLPNVSINQKTKILKRLQKFKYANYSDVHKNQIATYLNNSQSPVQELILLGGFLQMETTMLTLAEKHQDNESLLPYINMALVRAGNLQKGKTLQKNIEKLTVNDPFVYEVLPLLAYTKQPIIYDWLLAQITSDEKNCHPTDAEISGKINCAYRIMEAVAPAINDFPIQLDRWGDLAVDSYSEALAIVRIWITTNKRDYTLNKQMY